MQHCPTECSKVDDIRIQRHKLHVVTDKRRFVKTARFTANVVHMITLARYTGCEGHCVDRRLGPQGHDVLSQCRYLATTCLEAGFFTTYFFSPT